MVTDLAVAATAQGFQHRTRESNLETLPTLARMIPTIELEPRPWFNPGLEMKRFVVPGTIACLMLTTTILVTGFAIVREFELGTVEQLRVAPITAVGFTLGKTIPYLIIALAQLAVVLLTGIFWFQVPFHGSLLTLILGSVLFVTGTLMLGLFISAVSTTQNQALVVCFFIAFPAIVLSGYGQPVRGLPRVLQWLTYLNPLRFYLVVVEGTFQKGEGMAELWPEIVILTGFALVLIACTYDRIAKVID